jgi:hypothetical protein
MAAGPVGYGATALAITNDRVAVYEKEHGKPMPEEEVAKTYFIELGLLLPEYLLVKLHTSKLGKKIFGKNYTKKMEDTLWSKGKETLKAGTIESIQESSEAMEDIRSLDKEEDRNKSLSDKYLTSDVAYRGMQGALTGTALAGASESVPYIKKSVTEAKIAKERRSNKDRVEYKQAEQVYKDTVQTLKEVQTGKKDKQELTTKIV